MNSDFLELLAALDRHGAHYLVVGGYAVGAHGHPRATKDLDVWVEPSDANAPRVYAALAAFGAPLDDLRENDLVRPHYGFAMGRAPLRIDILTTVDGLDFAQAWPNRVDLRVAPDQSAPFIGLVDLLTNKRASGRLQDLADVEALERLERART